MVEVKIDRLIYSFIFRLQRTAVSSWQTLRSSTFRSFTATSRSARFPDTTERRWVYRIYIAVVPSFDQMIFFFFIYLTINVFFLQKVFEKTIPFMFFFQNQRYKIVENIGRKISKKKKNVIILRIGSILVPIEKTKLLYLLAFSTKKELISKIVPVLFLKNYAARFRIRLLSKNLYYFIFFFFFNIFDSFFLFPFSRA